MVVERQLEKSFLENGNYGVDASRMPLHELTRSEQCITINEKEK